MSKFSYIFCDAVTNEEKHLADDLGKFEDAVVVADNHNNSINRVDDMCDFIEEWEPTARNPKNIWQKSSGHWFKIVEDYMVIH